MNATKAYPALFAVLIVLGGAVVFGVPQVGHLFGFGSAFQPTVNPADSSALPSPVAELPTTDYVIPDEPPVQELPTPAAGASSAPAAAAKLGTLRVGNQTDHPVRVVLMLRSPKNPSANKQARPQESIHWDFAPGEGGVRGLKLSLPETDVRVAVGDVVVAFAIDGTRRYWGPNIVGETTAPFWNAKTHEWSMILQP